MSTIIRFRTTMAGSTSWPRSSPQRFRRGERPSLQEYIDRYPELADEIRELFPALVEVEQAEEDAAGATRRRRRRPSPCRRWARSATTGSSARSAGAAWASSTRPSRSRWAAAWRSKVLPRQVVRRPDGRWSGSAARPAPRRGCTTPTSCRSSRWARTAMSASTPCSSSRVRGSTWSSPSCGGSATGPDPSPRSGRPPRTSRRPRASTPPGHRRARPSATGSRSARCCGRILTGRFDPAPEPDRRGLTSSGQDLAGGLATPTGTGTDSRAAESDPH